MILDQSTINLMNELDALEWAKEFMRINKDKLQEIDEATMIAWFACAIMAGYDVATERAKA